MSVRMAVNNRVLAVARVEGQTDDAAIAVATALRDQYDREDRILIMLKTSIVPALAILALLAF